VSATATAAKRQEASPVRKLATPTNASHPDSPRTGEPSFLLAERFVLAQAGRDPPYLFSAEGALAAKLGSEMKLGGLALGSHFLTLSQVRCEHV
jgi:hypothetical protein